MPASADPHTRLLGPVAWVGGARLVVRLLGLASTLLLARLLTPADFGIVALATGVLGFLGAVTQMSFAQALIFYRDATDTDYATAWTLNLVRGAAISLLALGAAYPAAWMTGEPLLTGAIAATALITLIGEMENPRFVQFEKQLRFDTLFWLMSVTKVAGVVIAISGALIWRSYWALLAGMLASTLMRTALTFLMARGPLWLTARSWRKLLGFSGWLSGAEILGAVINRLDPIILGVFGPVQSVGFLHMARELTSITFNEIAAPLRRVLFPALTRHEIGGPRFVATYCEALAGLFMVLAPVTAGLALTAPSALPLLLGGQWTQVVVPVQLLAAALLFSIPGRIAQSAVMAAGRTRLIFTRNLVLLPVKLGAFSLGAFYYGLLGAVAGGMLAMALETLLNLDMARRVAGVRPTTHLAATGRSWLALAGMAIAVLALGQGPGMTADPWELGLHLGAQVATGALSYTAAHLLIWNACGRPQGPERTALGLARRALLRLRPQPRMP